MSALLQRLRTLFGLASAERDLDEELRDHVERQVEREMSRGLSREEALRATQLSFGHLESLKEESRDARGTRWTEDLLADLRHGARLVRRGRGFSIVAIGTLAMGIGAATVAFTVVNAVLVHTLPFAAYDRVALVWRQNLAAGQDRMTLSPADYLAYASRIRAFDAMGAARGLALAASVGDRPLAADGVQVTSTLFTTLGLSAAQGRVFTARDETAADGRVAMVTHEFWQRELDGDPRIVGRALSLRAGALPANPGAERADGAYTIVGVLPKGTRLPYRDAGVWIPLSLEGERTSRNQGGLVVFGRTAPGATLDQASREVSVVARELAAEFPEGNRNVSTWLATLRLEDVGDIAPTLALVAASVALLLLIVCGNLGNMLLVRFAGRRRELSVRRALGASSARIARQLFAESAILAAAGAGAGIAMAAWQTRLLALIGPGTIPRIGDVRFDGWAFAAALVIAAGMTLLFGMLPAMHISRDSASDLKVRSGNTEASGRMREVLVGAQLALAFVVLTGAGFAITSAVAMEQAPVGYDARNVLTFRIALPAEGYPTPAAREAFHTSLLERLRTTPGVEAAGAVNILPQMGTNRNVRFDLEGQPDAPEGDTRNVRFRIATSGYFASLGAPLLAGRDFETGDFAAGAVIVSRSLRDRVFNGENPIGRRVRLRLPNAEQQWFPVVGVVEDIRQWVVTPGEPTLYWANGAQSAYGVAVRGRAEPQALVATVRAAVREIDPAQPIFDVMTMRDRVTGGQEISYGRFRTIVMSGLGAAVLGLAILGIYGVVRQSVARRTQEFGIRLALGATPVAIAGMVARQSMRAVAGGIAVGLLLSVALLRVLGASLYGAAGAGATTISAIAALLVASALAAALGPARRAARVDPIRSLRGD